MFAPRSQINLFIPPLPFPFFASRQEVSGESGQEAYNISYGAKLFHENVFELKHPRGNTVSNKIRATTSLIVGAPLTGLGTLYAYGGAVAVSGAIIGLRVAVGIPLRVAAAALAVMLDATERRPDRETGRTLAELTETAVELALFPLAIATLAAVQCGISAVEALGYGAGWTVGAVASVPWSMTR